MGIVGATRVLESVNRIKMKEVKVVECVFKETMRYYQ